ncbi:MAG: PAS domain S-box protein, partial [Bacteroidota bacterium]|nr:PAS domain S-box protein [Bacteroidota bacterium]
MKNQENKLKDELNKEIEVLQEKVKNLEKSEEKFRLIAENTSDVITLQTFDLKSSYTYVSSSVKVLAGYEPEELLGKSCFDIIHPEDKKVLFPLLKKFIAYKLKNLITGKESTFNETIELRIKNKSGKWIYVQSTANILGDQLLFVTRNITERKQTEKALQESENQLQTLIDAMPDFVCFKDGNGRWLKANDASIRIFQLSNIDYRGKKDSELAKLNSNLRGAFITCSETDAKAWNKGAIIHTEETVTDPDGLIRVFDVSKVPVFYPDGKRKGLIVLGHDITDRKNVEDTLKQSEKKHRDLFKKSKDAMLIIHNGKFADCNQATINMLGYNNKDEFLNTHPSEISPEKQADGKLSFTKANEMMEVALKNGSHRFEWNHKKSNEVVFPVEVMLTAISTDEKNQILYTIWRDITDRKKAEEEIRKLSKVAETTPDAIVISDIEGKIEYVNRGLLSLGGFKDDSSIIGKPVFMFTNEKGIKQLKEEVIPTILSKGKWEG